MIIPILLGILRNIYGGGSLSFLLLNKWET